MFLEYVGQGYYDGDLGDEADNTSKPCCIESEQNVGSCLDLCSTNGMFQRWWAKGRSSKRVDRMPGNNGSSGPEQLACTAGCRSPPTTASLDTVKES